VAQGNVNWDDLRVVLEVIVQKSVHAAAKRLKLDHSTVGRRIDRLEAQLGVKLFERTQRGVILREEADELVQHLRAMDLHASSLTEALAQSTSHGVDIVRIATMEGIASRYIARRVPELARFTKSVRLELVSIPQKVDLSRKEADIFLSFYDPHLPGLESKAIAAFNLFLYSSARYRSAFGAPRDRDDLKNHRFVSYIEDLLAIEAVRWLDEVITGADVVFASNSVIAQCSAALSGVGLVLLPTFVAAEIDGLERVLADQIVVRRQVFLSVRREQMFHSRIKQTMRFLETIFAEDKDFLEGRAARLSGASD
jgi:DNA-binding transcriptional LysR family regulator